MRPSVWLIILILPLLLLWLILPDSFSFILSRFSILSTLSVFLCFFASWRWLPLVVMDGSESIKCPGGFYVRGIIRFGDQSIWVANNKKQQQTQQWKNVQACSCVVSVSVSVSGSTFIVLHLMLKNMLVAISRKRETDWLADWRTQTQNLLIILWSSISDQ